MIGTGRGDLGVKRVCLKRPRAGGQQDMLAQHVFRAGATGFPVQRAGAHGIKGGLALDHLKAVCGDQNSL